MTRSKRFISIGITAGLIAAGFWFLHHLDYGPLSASNSWWSMHQGWNGPGAMMGFGSGMGIFMLLFWGLIIFALVSLIAKANRPIDSTANSLHDPLEILKQRYARGEINKKQFEALRHELGV